TGDRPGAGQAYDLAAVVAAFLNEISGFVHVEGLVVHYRLRGKPKRPIRQTERRAGIKVSDTA
ncbi:MAG: hypothetical protein ACK4S5_10195, partial [Sphingobium yanoikuyae]